MATGVGFLAALGTIVTSVLAFWPSDGESEANPAERVSACMAQHGLSRARDSFPRGQDTTVFASCAWPAPPFADADGYAEIVVRGDLGPGQTEASGVSFADRIAAPCLELEVAYSFGLQGAFERRPPFYLQRGSVVTMDGIVAGEVWKGDERSLPFYPERDEAVILHNSRNRLDYVRCIIPA